MTAAMSVRAAVATNAAITCHAMSVCADLAVKRSLSLVQTPGPATSGSAGTGWYGLAQILEAQLPIIFLERANVNE